VSQSSHIVKQHYRINKTDRATANGHRSCVVWLTGLSGSGKSTIANATEVALHEKGIRTYVLDGDNIRHGLNSNLDFSEAGRQENIRRIGEVAKLFVDAGIVVLTAFISPFRTDRDRVRALLEKGEFVEVFVDCPLDVCEGRDVKGLYKKARAGEIPHFTGISSPFEKPAHPELTLHTDKDTIETNTQKLTGYILDRILPKK
jgi:adenylylsulfate kinase